MDLGQSTALVTGGAVRIGRAICEALADKGCGVVIHCHQSRKEADALVGFLSSAAWVVQGDLADRSDRDRIMKEAVSQAGSLNILINNAAVFHKTGLMDTTEEQFLSELQVNLVAPAMLTQAFAGLCTIPAAVVNLLDRRVAGVDPECLPYELSKKMLAEITKTAAEELAPDVRVNGVAPGPVLPPPGKGEEAIRDLAGALPLGKRPTTGDVAGAVIFLLESESLTGEIVYVDAGQHLGIEGRMGE